MQFTFRMVLYLWSFVKVYTFEKLKCIWYAHVFVCVHVLMHVGSCAYVCICVLICTYV